MINIEPLIITDGMMTSDIPETDYTEWDIATSFGLGVRCMITATGYHDVYQSVVAGNVGNDPRNETDPVNAPVKWQYVGKTNRWKPFDNYISSQASQAEAINYSIVVPSDYLIDSIFLGNIDAYQARLTVTHPTDGVISDQTFTLVSESGVTDYWEYCFLPVERRYSLVLTGLPVYSGVTVALQLTDPGGTAKIGAFGVGLSRYVGATQYGFNLSSTDYSVKKVDDFGNITLVQRPYSDDISLNVEVENTNLESVKRYLSSLRGKMSVTVGDDGVFDEAATIFGWPESQSIVVSYPTHSILAVNFKGLT